ncbi:MAG: DDE-type integrase/transposase/recombinase [Thermomicrobiales bacterium]
MNGQGGEWNDPRGEAAERRRSRSDADSPREPVVGGASDPRMPTPSGACGWPTEFAEEGECARDPEGGFDEGASASDFHSSAEWFEEDASDGLADACEAGAPERIGSADALTSLPRLMAGPRKRGRRLAKPTPPVSLTPQQRLLLLDTWRRSGLPAGDFAPLVGVSKHTLYAWKKRFEELGPAGLMDQPRGGPKGSKLPELTKRTILMLKESNPDWGCQRISDLLARGPALPASPPAVARVLHEAGYQLEETPTRVHAPKVNRFERAHANQLWQTDLFTFVLKRQNRRVYLVGFLDDASRFIVGYGLHASQSSALVLEVLRAAITSYGTPQEILTDNGSQYVTWRGKSAFSRECEKRGIRQIVATPRRPQTLGKIERFWGTLWRECIETAVFLDLGDAVTRIGLFMDHYNFQRPHQGLGGLVPADRYFGAAPEVLRAMKDRVAANALELARGGIPKQPFYITGQVGGKPFSVHTEGERVILSKEGSREEVELVGPAPNQEPHPAAPSLPTPICPAGVPQSGWNHVPENAEPGVSPLDDTFAPIRSPSPPSGECSHDTRSEGGES